MSKVGGNWLAPQAWHLCVAPFDCASAVTTAWDIPSTAAPVAVHGITCHEQQQTGTGTLNSVQEAFQDTHALL